MKFIKNNILAVMLLLSGAGLLAGCQKEESNVAKAVLASVSNLSFDAERPVSQIITVYSDAQWTADVPDWVTIDPVTGSGTVDVTVSVSDNMREGTPDNPRKADLVFHGSTIASRAVVTVSQSGDKYRDVPNSSVSDVVGSPDGTVVIVPDAQVAALTTKGVVVSDGKANIYIHTDPSSLAIGDKVSFRGDKESENGLPSLIVCDEFAKVSSGSFVPGTPKDITDGFDKYTSSSREYVTFKGVLRGDIVSVEGATLLQAAIQDAHKSVGLDKYNGWIVTVKGYFAGVATPFTNIIATEIIGEKSLETIWWSEDFEWLDPWSAAKDAGRTVETDDLDAYCPQLTTPKIGDVSALQALNDKGYEMLLIDKDGKVPTAMNIYLQRNYLKFGKTGVQGGIRLPAIKDIPDGKACLISFEWCPMRQGSGKFDPVNLIIEVSNGSDVKVFDVPESGFENGRKLEWIPVRIALAGAAVNENTVIVIKQTQWGVSTANRWFLDNIKIFSEAEL